MKPTPKLTLRSLALLLGYPDADLRAALPHLTDALRRERALPAQRQDELVALVAQLASMDAFDAEERYVDTFDRGRATSLHLFEHVHGDSRERGPALVDLGLTYERAGLVMQGRELPDHLSIVLEFASTQPPDVSREFLGELAHILVAIFSALRDRGSPYASAVAAVLELAGRKVESVPFTADVDVDEAWAEPPAFDGCSTQGQARAGTPQPIRIVRRDATARAPGATA